MNPMQDRRHFLATLGVVAAGAGAPLDTALAAAQNDARTPHAAVPPFRAGSGDTLVAGWAEQRLPNVQRTNRFALVEDDGQTVLQVQSDHSASSYATALAIDPAKTPVLRWRWWVSHALAGSDITKKSGDDFAARVYVLFDVPLDRLSFTDRIKIQAARVLSGEDVPAAALCYVWGQVQPVGFSGWNAYSDRLRMIVLESGDAHARTWRSASCNVAADFRAAFGGEAPMIYGLAVAADTDNIGTEVVARFTSPSFGAAA